MTIWLKATVLATALICQLLLCKEDQMGALGLPTCQRAQTPAVLRKQTLSCPQESQRGLLACQRMLVLGQCLETVPYDDFWWQWAVLVLVPCTASLSFCPAGARAIVIGTVHHDFCSAQLSHLSDRLLVFWVSMRSQTFIQGAPRIHQKLEARRTIAISREAASHQTHRIQQLSLVCRRKRTHRRKKLILRASTSNFEEELREVKEEADSKLPDVPKLDKKIE